MEQNIGIKSVYHQSYKFLFGGAQWFHSWTNYLRPLLFSRHLLLSRGEKIFSDYEGGMWSSCSLQLSLSYIPEIPLNPIVAETITVLRWPRLIYRDLQNTALILIISLLHLNLLLEKKIIGFSCLASELEIRI